MYVLYVSLLVYYYRRNVRGLNGHIGNSTGHYIDRTYYVESLKTFFSHAYKGFHSNKQVFGFYFYSRNDLLTLKNNFVASQLKIILTSVNFCIFWEIEDGNSKTDFSPDLQRATFP